MARRLLILLLALLVPVPAGAAGLAVRAGTLHPVSGPPLADGVVLIRDGKIDRVGPASEIAVPEGWEVLEAAVVVPGLVDAHSTVGLSGILNTPHDQDQRDESEQIQPELRALDAFDLREPLVAWVRELGVTTVHTGHGPGNVVTGQTMVTKTWGADADAAALLPFAMVAATLGPGAVEGGKEAPGTRAKAMAMLRAELVQAREWMEEREDERPADLRLAALARVLAGEKPLLVTVHRHTDILTALRLQREFGFRLVLDGAAEAHQVLDALVEAEVPIVLHPTMARAGSHGGGSETENISFTTAARLHRRGLLFALQSGYESYVPKTRVVLFEAALAAAHGLPREAALRSITLDAARILGVDDRVGSLEAGKDADLALYDGDPFEYTTHCVGVVIDGEVVSRTVR